MRQTKKLSVLTCRLDISMNDALRVTIAKCTEQHKGDSLDMCYRKRTSSLMDYFVKIARQILKN